MHAHEVVLIDVVASRGYNTGGAGSLLMVGQSTLASRGDTGTLGSGATPTLGAASSEGMDGDKMVRRLWIAICRVMALCAMAGRVPSSTRRTSHAVNTVTLLGEMVGVAQCLGKMRQVLAIQYCHVADTKKRIQQ